MKKKLSIKANEINKPTLNKPRKVITKKPQSTEEEAEAAAELSRTAFRSKKHSESNDGSSKNTHEGKTHRAGQHPASSNDNKEDRDSMHENRVD